MMRTKLLSNWAIVFIIWLIAIAVSLLAVSASGQTPTGMQKWDMGQGQTKEELGGRPVYYPSSDSWLPIETDWKTLDDTLYTTRNGVLKTDVNNDGQIYTSVTIGGYQVTVAKRLLSLRWYRLSDSAWLPIDNTPNWTTPSVDSNVIGWPNVFPGVDVNIIKQAGQADYGLFFKSAFLDYAVNLYNQRADSGDIYLANIMACQLTGVGGADSSIGTVTKRKLKQYGSRALQFKESFLQYPRQRGDPHIPIYQRHRVISGTLYIVEFVKMSDLKWAHEKYPTETLWHHSSTVLQSTALWDNMLDNDDQGNQGTSTVSAFYVGFSSLFLIGYEGLDAIVGTDTRDSAVVRFRSVADFFDPGPAELYGVWKWQATESGSDWGDWKSAPGRGWGTDGCNSTNDAGSFNTGNGSGDDRTATAINTVSFAAQDAWYEILDDEWFPASEDSIIWAVKAGTGADGNVAMSEHGTFPLIVTIYYTAAGAPEQLFRRRRLLIGGN